MYTSLPPKQGLYDPWFEHDACGLGVVANIKGRKSNKILRQALVVLRNMDHRGGQGADMNSGDGAGLGLAITRSIARAHGGDIEGRAGAQSNVFEMWIPVLKNTV